MNYPIDKYKSQAATAFSDLLQTFKGWGNGWQVGNVFDTLTDYVVRFPDAEPSRGAVVEAALERWKDKNVQGSMSWYDDYGWWGIAGAKAFDDAYADIFGPHRSEFQQLATDCWNVMHTGKPDKPPYKWKGGPRVWENRDEGQQPEYFTSPDTWAVPRFPGGVWQYDMFKDWRPNPPENSPSNPSDPNFSKLGPFQNTVMNGLYFVLALRLQDKGAGAVEAAKTEMAFLKEWFSLEGDESLLWWLDDGTRLVRERVPTYAYCEEKNGYPWVRGYVPSGPKGVWGGDQGLILGGLLDYLSVAPSDKMAQVLAVNIARGVLLNMVDDQGVLPYSSDFDDQDDPGDYSCGSGVFWRYLLHGFGRNPALRTEVLTLIANDPENNAIYKSAEHPQAHAPSDNSLFAQFNALATLTAAIEILKEADG